MIRTFLALVCILLVMAVITAAAAPTRTDTDIGQVQVNVVSDHGWAMDVETSVRMNVVQDFDHNDVATIAAKEIAATDNSAKRAVGRRWRLKSSQRPHSDNYQLGSAGHRARANPDWVART